MISPSFKNGALIKSVDKNSTAFNEGLRQGMIITELNSQPVKNANDYTKALGGAFSSENLSRLSIKTSDGGDFIFMSAGAPDITVGDIPRTKIKTGLDLSGGARALVKPVNVSLSSTQLGDLVATTSERLNTFGISDVNVRPVSDLEGNNFMLVEIAGATPADLRELVGKQGKFEAKISNHTVFEGEDNDISDVCRNDAKCAVIRGCQQAEGGYSCEFNFAIYLTPEASRKHAEATQNLTLDETGRYLSEKIYFYIDGNEASSLYIGADLKGQLADSLSIQGYGSGKTQAEALAEAKKEMSKLQTILITGSLPYQLEIVKLDTISPFLGEEFTRSLLLLGLVAFLIVSALIFIKYRRIKITLAVILTMFSEVILTLGVAALIRWNLDAPAIAGIIAGIGTGVNDQIVILDEARKGGDNESSGGIKERVKRALFIIIGAFLTIVAAMIPLFWAGAGMLRGFALTTIIGVTVGILITRPAFADIIKRISE